MFSESWTEVASYCTPGGGCDAGVTVDFVASYLQFKYSPSSMGYLMFWLQFGSEYQIITLPGNVDSLKGNIFWTQSDSTAIDPASLVTDPVEFSVRVNDEQEVVLSIGDFSASHKYGTTGRNVLIYKSANKFSVFKNQKRFDF